MTVNDYRWPRTKSTVFVEEERFSMAGITPAQSRAARGLLDWSQAELAKRSNLGESTIRDFEKGRRVPTINNLIAIRSAIEVAGVMFIDENGDGPGVRLKKARFP